MSIENHRIGDLWQQMDLHVHTPISAETRYGDKNSKSTWDRFFQAIRELESGVSVLGINDYWSVDGYRRVKKEHDRGNLPNVKLLLPVVEMRLTDSINEKRKKTKKQNYHVCFDNKIDSDVIDQYFLGKLETSFKFSDGTQPAYLLGRHGFIELGRRLVEERVVAAPDGVLNEDTFHSIGRKHFAVGLEQVRALLQEPWFKGRTLEFVGYSETKDLLNSGYEGMDKRFLMNADGAFLASPEPEAFAHNQKLLATAKSGIPLIHASDAHRFDDGSEQTRYLGKSRMWVRCSPNFESLRFAVKKFQDRLSFGEPEESKQKRGVASNIIERLTVESPENGPVVFDYGVELNPGYTVIVGNRGKGKSALADWIAVSATSNAKTSFAFLNEDRFRPARKGAPSYQLTSSWTDGSEVEFTWENGAASKNNRVDYYPQSRIEELCSADPGAEGAKFLESLIGDLLFRRISEVERRGASSLDELKNQLRKSIDVGNAGVDVEYELRSALTCIKRISEINGLDLGKRRASVEEELSLLREKGNVQYSIDADTLCSITELNEQAALAAESTKAWAARNDRLDDQIRQIDHSDSVRDEITRIAQDWISGIRGPKDFWDSQNRWDSLLSDHYDRFESYVREWYSDLQLNLQLLSSELRQRKEEIEATLEALGLTEADIENRQRLQDDGNRDRQQFNQLKNGVTDPAQDQWSLTGIQALLDEKDKKQEQLNEIASRLAAYAVRSHRENVEAATQLTSLLNASLDGLSLGDGSVRIRVKVADRFNPEILRPSLKVKGQDQFEALCAERSAFDDELEVLSRANIETFMENVIQFALLAQEGGILRNTSGALGSFDFLRHLTDFSTYDIRVELALDGNPLSQLSPGQRGLVLLLFILEADQSTNVLLIDQPEDNLDNDAIKRLLIPALDRARKKRQVIVVTHNANIGVLGDPDQVVSCQFEENVFSLRSGSITDDGMQRELLRILEGAEDAFRDRANRYGLVLS